MKKGIKTMVAVAALTMMLSGCAAALGYNRPALQLGMTKTEVAASWGRPDKTSRSRSVWGETEFWQYGYAHETFVKKYWLTFRDGKLADIME